MNIKRILATLLCFTMIMTSGVFTSTAYAEELNNPDIILEETMTDDLVGAEEEESGEISLDESASKETVSEENASKETAEEGEIDLIEEETTEENEEFISEDEELLIESDIEAEEDAETEDDIDELALQLSEDLLEVKGGELAWIEEPTTPEELQERYTALGQTLYVPAGTEVIPEEFFKGDHALTKIDVTYAENTLTTIEDGAFRNCTELSVFTASAALETIGANAFSGCGKLKTVALSKVLSIGEGAFQNTGVTQITASGCTEVGDNAFNGCTELVGISFPVVQEIGYSAFSGCTSLENLGLPVYDQILKRVGDYAFKNTATKNVNWSNYVFPSNDTDYYMGNGVFSNCKSLTYIALPAIETVPASTCEKCTALSTIIINSHFVNDTVHPTTTTAIDGAAFSGCTALKKVSLSKIKRVVTSAFASDVNLIEVKFEYEGPDADFKIDNDAFPDLGTPANLKMYGYVDAVHNYADKKGYTFVSLYEPHKITYRSVGEGFTTKLSKASARKDELISVTVTNNDGNFLLNDVEVVGVSSQKRYDTTLTKNGKYEAVFSFNMPSDEDVKINLTSAPIGTVKSNANISFFTVDSVRPEPYYFVPTGGNGNYNIDSSGKEFWIRFSNGYPCVGDKNWQWIFTSNNSNVVRVNELGLVTAVGKGFATITAQLKNTNVKIEQFFTVGATTRIVSVAMNPITPSRGSLSVSETGIPIISVDRDYVANSAMSFTTQIVALDEENSEVIVAPSYWSSVDTKNAIVASAKSFDNTMKITIPKGAVGETMIKAYALNEGEKTVNANSVNENGKPLEEGDDGYTDNLALLIIRVVDFTPRLENKSFDVDYNSSIGTKLQLIEVYDELGKIDTDTGLDIVQKKTVGKEVTAVTPTNFGLQVFYDRYGIYNDGIPGFYAQKNDHFNSIKENEEITYKNMFLHGFFDKGEKREFFIPLGTVKLTNKPLNTKLTFSGKINYFYGTSAEGLENRSQVTVVQSLKNKKIESVELKDARHHTNPANPQTDLFKENFKIDFDRNDNSKIYITMNPTLEALKTNDSNVAVVSGYLYIYYVGYSNPVKIAITVPTCNTPPAYLLSTTSVTMNFYAKNQKASFYLYKKNDAKKTPVSLDGMTISFNKSLTTGNIFDGTITTSKYDCEDDYDSVITIKQNNTYSPVPGKAVIRMHHSSWADGKYVDYTCKVNAVKTKPNAKIYGSSTATLNQQVLDGTSTIWIYSSQDNVPISAQSDDVDDMRDSVITTVAKNRVEAAQYIIDNCLDIDVDIEPNTGKQMLYITASCPDSEEVPKGKYTFKITPKVDYLNGEPGTEVQPIAFAVNITNTKITLTMKGALLFNKDCAGLEKAETTYTLKNLPTGAKQRDYQIDINGAEIVKPKNVTKEMVGDILNVKWIWFEADIDTNKNTCYFGGILNGARRKDNAFKYTYTVKGAKLLDSTGTEVSTLADFKITVQMREVTSSFDVTASGSISTVDYYKPSCITYTAKPKNFNTYINDVKLVEIDDSGNDKPINEYFELKRDYYGPTDTILHPDADSSDDPIIRDDKKAYVSLIQGKDVSERVVPGKKYKIRLEYTLSSRTDWAPYKVFEIVVKQSTPGLTAKYDVNKIYAGQDNRTVNVKIKPTALHAKAQIIDVDFKDGINDKYYQAFTLNRDETTGSATTTWQEVDGYNRPIFIDYTNPGNPLKMYVDKELPSGDNMYNLQDGDVLYYVDSSINKVAIYSAETEEYYSYKPNCTEPILVNDKYMTVLDIKPDYYCTFSMTLTNSSALVLNKEHSVNLVTIYEEAGRASEDPARSSEVVKGTAFKITLNVLK